MSAPILIRDLEADDIAALQTIDRAAHGEAWSQRTFFDQIEADHFTHLVGADSAGTILGHAAAWLDDSSAGTASPALRIINVATDPAATGQGVATRLLHTLLLDGLVGVGAVQLEVRPGNRRAQRLYGRFGFAPVGVARNFYDRRDTDGSRDAVVMSVVEPDSPEWRRRLAAIADQLEAAA